MSLPAELWDEILQGSAQQQQQAVRQQQRAQACLQVNALHAGPRPGCHSTVCRKHYKAIKHLAGTFTAKRELQQQDICANTQAEHRVRTWSQG